MKKFIFFFFFFFFFLFFPITSLELERKEKITERKEISGRGKEMSNLYCLVSNNTISLSDGNKLKYLYPFTFTTETFQLNNIGHNVIPLEVDTSVEPVKIIVNEMTCNFPEKDFDYSQLSPILRLQFKLRESKGDDPRYLFDVLYDYSIFQLLPSGETKVLYQSNLVETGKGEEKKKKERSWSIKKIHSFSLKDGQILNA